MMDIDTIRSESEKKAKEAAKSKKKPYIIFDEKEIDSYGESKPFPFPNIGSYIPSGWALVKNLFCDSSGFGSESEPALTIHRLKEVLKEYVREKKTYGFAITEVGQFQLYLGVFEIIGESNDRKNSVGRRSKKAG